MISLPPCLRDDLADFLRDLEGDGKIQFTDSRYRTWTILFQQQQPCEQHSWDGTPFVDESGQSWDQQCERCGMKEKQG